MLLRLSILIACCSFLACAPKKTVKLGQGGLIGKNPNCFHIVNGQTTNAHPAVTLILNLQNNRIHSSCTGTFIGPKTVLTAAHCIVGSVIGISRATQINMLDPSTHPAALGTFIAASKIINNDPTINSREAKPSDARSDIAILIFSTVVAPEVAPLLDRAPITGDQATIVGFGNDNVQFSYSNPTLHKRFGYNTVTVESPIGISATGRPGTVANTGAQDAIGAMGDSGGPLFINGKVAGILALYKLETQSSAKNYYGDMSDAGMRVFLQSAIAQGADFALPALTGPVPPSNALPFPKIDCLL